MYSQNDLDEAVASGAVSADAANALRAFIDQQRATPAVDEEQFRLITGFNDIFVSIAAAILLFAVGFIGQSLGQSLGLIVDVDGPSPLAPLFVAATAWGLAMFFTAKRRMALPSILLLLAFVGSLLAFAGFSLVLAFGPDNLENNERAAALIGSAAAAIAAGGAWLHWRTFRVPITVAAEAAAVAAIAVGLLASALATSGTQEHHPRLCPAARRRHVPVCHALGFVDPARVTRRSDVAFWLHLLAAPMIVHPIFSLLGLNDGTATIGEGLVVILLYIAMGITALAIDRRALARLGARLRALCLNELFGSSAQSN
jgi:hypothetical protein